MSRRVSLPESKPSDQAPMPVAEASTFSHLATPSCPYRPGAQTRTREGRVLREGMCQRCRRRHRWDAGLMPEDVGVDPEGPRAAMAPRGLVSRRRTCPVLGLAVAANTLGGSSTQPPPRPPPADANTTVSDPTPPDSTTTPENREETALPAIGGLALGGPRGSTYLTRSDPTAVNGPWTVVVRRAARATRSWARC